MIDRYSRPEMVRIWSDENKYQIWLDIEAYACEANVVLGVIPAQTVVDIRKHGQFNISRINELEKTLKHDVIAFLTNLAEYVGPNARFIHQGMTSSDVLDTCLSVQLKQSGELLLSGVNELLNVLKERALEFKHTPCVGRSHGIHAEPTTFGLKLLGFYVEWIRNRDRLKAAIKEISTCAISGPVGTYSSISPYVEEYVANKLGLVIEPVSTQVIPRDRHAMYFATLGVIASSIERLAIEIRHLQRTEVLEAEEFFSKGQKGSSAMPHKRNPILTENLTGLARMIRSSVTPALENVALWHERDISHSSAERMFAPDANVLMDFALHRLISVVKNLVVYPKNMQRNLDKLDGLIFSQPVLLALTQIGVDREQAYYMVQRNAMRTLETNESFLESLMQDEEVSDLLVDKIEDIFDLDKQLKHVDTIFTRVLEDSVD